MQDTNGTQTKETTTMTTQTTTLTDARVDEILATMTAHQIVETAAWTQVEYLAARDLALELRTARLLNEATSRRAVAQDWRRLAAWATR